MGSVVSWKRGPRDGIPPYVSMPSVTRSGGPNFLGGQHAPFVIDGSPNSAGFRVRDVVLPADISEGRAASRRQLRAALDGMKRHADKLAEDPAVAFDQYLAQGVSLVLSDKARRPSTSRARTPRHAMPTGATTSGSASSWHGASSRSACRGSR